MNQKISSRKDEIRAQFRAFRKTLSLQERLDASKRLEKEIFSFSHPFKYVASFSSFGSEISLCSINERFCVEKRLLLPKTEEQTMSFYKIHTPSSRFGEHSHNGCERFSFSELDTEREVLLLVPGLVFSLDGHRLGYGMGFYDRFLAMHPNIFSVGVGFCMQLSSQPLPIDLWDIPVKKLILV